MDKINKLIEDNLGLVYKQLHRFNRAYDDDVYCFAVEALWKAAETYDDTRSVSFSTYASVCIYNAIVYYIREETRGKKNQPLYFEDVVNEGSCGEKLRIADITAAPDTVETEYLRGELYEYLWKAFDKLYADTKSETSRRILDVWRESDFTMNQPEIAKVVGVTQSNVSRVLSAFKHKLKKEMEDYLCRK